MQNYKINSASPVLDRRSALTRLTGIAAVALGAPALALAARQPLRIGSTLDLSGALKEIGTALDSGALAYIKAINKAGGVNGATIELSTLDDRFDPAQTVANAQVFQNDPSVLAMLHPLGVVQTAAVMKVVHDLAVVGPYAGLAALRKKESNNVFWLRASYDQEIEKLIVQAIAVGITRIGLVYPDDIAGQSAKATMNATMAKFKLAPAVMATTPNSLSSEVGSAALAIAKASPQVVIVGLGVSGPAFIRALRAAGSKCTVYGLSITGTPQNIKELGPLARGLGFSQVVPSPFATRYPLVRQYRIDMAANGSQDYSWPSLEGYMNAKVLVEGLRRAGANPTRESVVQAIAGIDNLDIGGVRIGFGKTGREGNSFVEVVVVGANGKIVN